VIQSMTGFGEAQHHEPGLTYTLEIRSLNNRYFKPAIKLPEPLQFLEANVEKLLRSRLGRGSVTYTLRLRSETVEAAHDINTAALEWYLGRLRQVQPPGGPVSIDMATILTLPGVCQPRQVDDDARHAQWQTIRQLTEEALDRLLAMRREEGQALRLDLLTQCQAIREHLDVVARRAPSVIQEYHQRLARRVGELTAGATLELNKADLAREVAVFAERSDVNEELARLASHLDQFVQLCDSKEHAGRKLDFIAQEMLREANTIGSKGNDGEIAREIVEVKSRIDRLKEQVQNVE